MQHEVGSIVEGKVTGITKFGAFIELEDGSVGMVHISEISQSYVNDISDFLQDQQMVKVKILNIGDDGKISLSIKRAQPPAPNQNFQRRDSRPASSNGGGRPGNYSPRPNNSRGGYANNRSSSAPTGNSSFEDMLSKFIKQSDERMSDIKQPERRRGYQRKDSRDYE